MCNYNHPRKQTSLVRTVVSTPHCGCGNRSSILRLVVTRETRIIRSVNRKSSSKKVEHEVFVSFDFQCLWFYINDNIVLTCEQVKV